MCSELYFPSHFPPFLCFPFMCICFLALSSEWQVLVLVLVLGRKLAPGDLGEESLGAAFPSLQGCCRHSLWCRSEPASWGLVGRGLCYTLILEGMLSLRVRGASGCPNKPPLPCQQAIPALALCLPPLQ